MWGSGTDKENSRVICASRMTAPAMVLLLLPSSLICQSTKRTYTKANCGFRICKWISNAFYKTDYKGNLFLRLCSLRCVDALQFRLLCCCVLVLSGTLSCAERQQTLQMCEVAGSYQNGAGIRNRVKPLRVSKMITVVIKNEIPRWYVYLRFSNRRVPSQG